MFSVIHPLHNRGGSDDRNVPALISSVLLKVFLILILIVGVIAKS